MQAVQQNGIQFKSNINSPAMARNNRYNPPMQNNDINDVFMLQQLEQQKAAKRERSRDRWNKAGVVAQFGIAGGFIASALVGFLTMKVAKKGISGINAANKGGDLKNTILNFKPIKQGSVPELTSDSVNPKSRDFIKMVKDRIGMDEKIAKYSGSKSAEQCVLFHGPSGTGKTFSAKLMANELGAEYAEVDFPKIASPYVGQASKNINKIFDDIALKAKAEPEKKFLIAFNEIDSMLIPMENAGSNKSYVLENRTAFLNGLDSIKELKNVKIVGTTNADPKSGNLDAAALSRFGNLFEIELPTKKEIVASLKWHLKDCEAISKHDFFEKNKTEIDRFANSLVKKHFSQRDVEKIAESAQTRFGIAIKDKPDALKQNFDIKYLKEALDNKDFTTGSLKKGKNSNESKSIKDLTFLQRLAILFGGTGK